MLLVDYDGKNSPAFMCGKEDHFFDADSIDGAVVGFGHLLEADSSLAQLTELEQGYEYERSSVGAPWIKLKVPEGSSKN